MKNVNSIKYKIIKHLSIISQGIFGIGIGYYNLTYGLNLLEIIALIGLSFGAGYIIEKYVKEYFAKK